MAVLVTGGAGYIGSHVVKSLKDKGEEIVVVDNYSTSHPQFIDGVIYHNHNFGDKAFLLWLFEKYDIQAVIHLAGLIDVEESGKDIPLYYKQNIFYTDNLIRIMLAKDVDKIVFASSSAVYGNPIEVPIKEEARRNPVSIYGITKKTGEDIIQNSFINHVILRFFNVAGSSGELGEKHKKETHVIPNLIEAGLDNKTFSVFGKGYHERDFIHVSDLAEAHVMALFKLYEGEYRETFNVGCGRAYSVLGLIKLTERLLNKDIDLNFEEEREGDPIVLLSDVEKIKKELGFYPKYNIKDIIESHIKWMKKGG